MIGWVSRAFMPTFHHCAPSIIVCAALVVVTLQYE
jgi:hypothetical protein